MHMHMHMYMCMHMDMCMYIYEVKYSSCVFISHIPLVIEWTPAVP